MRCSVAAPAPTRVLEVATEPASTIYLTILLAKTSGRFTLSSTGYWCMRTKGVTAGHVVRLQCAAVLSPQPQPAWLSCNRTSFHYILHYPASKKLLTVLTLSSTGYCCMRTKGVTFKNMVKLQCAAVLPHRPQPACQKLQQNQLSPYT
jgi:hypothetical protein